jgi:hypothetical protein
MCSTAWGSTTKVGYQRLVPLLSAPEPVCVVEIVALSGAHSLGHCHTVRYVLALPTDHCLTTLPCARIALAMTGLGLGACGGGVLPTSPDFACLL